MLGRNHGDSLHGNLWAAAKWLELCPNGTVVRNGCDHRAPAGEGTHMRKVDFDNWVPCMAREPYAMYEWHYPNTVHIRAKDIWLPVQVVVRGKDE